MRTALQPSLLGWFWQILPFTDRDPHPPELSIISRKRTDALFGGVDLRGPSAAHVARVLLSRDGWMRFNTRSYRALPLRPLDNRVVSKLTLSHHAATGVEAYAVDLKA